MPFEMKTTAHSDLIDLATENSEIHYIPQTVTIFLGSQSKKKKERENQTMLLQIHDTRHIVMRINQSSKALYLKEESKRD